MADLPDLDESNISFCAYWNIIDDGGIGSVDPEEMLSDGNIQEYTLYDNGWEGDYDSVTGRTITVRAKTDGWIVAYLDRDNEYEQNIGDADDARGVHDVVNKWNNSGSTDDLVENTLERAINSVASEIDDWDQVDYSADNVGLFNFEYTDATNTTLLSAQNGDASTNTYGFLFTDGTDVKHIVAIGSAGVNGSNFTGASSSESSVSYEGTQLAEEGPTTADTESYGVLDILNTADDADTEYQFETSGDEGDSTSPKHKVSLLAVWE